MRGGEVWTVSGAGNYPGKLCPGANTRDAHQVMIIRLSRRAEMDLIEITYFIALDNPECASEFEEELLEQARKIAKAPLG